MSPLTRAQNCGFDLNNITNLTRSHVDGLTSTELALAVRGRYQRVLAGAVSQGDVEQANPTSTTSNPVTIVVWLASVQKTSDCFVEVEWGCQFVSVTAQLIHHLDFLTSERLRHRYEQQWEVLLVPSHPCISAVRTVARAMVREQHHCRVLEAPRVVERAEEPTQKLVHEHGCIHVPVRQT